MFRMPRSEPEATILPPVTLKIGDVIPFDGITDAQWLDHRLSETDRRIAMFRLGYASRAVMADSNRRGWFCLCVRSGKEKSVENILNKIDVSSFLPMTWPYEYASRGRIKIKPPMPVMSGYILFECGMDRRAFLGIEAIEHVTGVLGGVDRPIPVADEKVNTFKQYLATDTKAEPPEKPKEVPVVAGDTVLVKVGPWADFVGTIVKTLRSRVVVGLSLYGRQCEVEHPLAYVRKL